MTEKIAVKCVVQISQEMITNLFITAFEGGCNYWVNEVKLYDFHGISVGYEEDTNFSEDIKVIHFYQEGKSSNLCTNKIQAGLEKMAEISPEHFADIIQDNIDAETADVFIQCCMFNEVIYG